jgi:Cof subfamily protein (haloacid dehalogenase superfamily)
VTGRPIRWMESLWDHVGDHGLAICSNGGILYDVATHTVVRARTIPRETGLAVVERIRESVPGSYFALEKTAGFGHEATYPVERAASERDRPQVGPLPEIFDHEVVKLLALHERHEPVDYWQRVEEAVGADVTTTWSSTNALVEMSGAGVSKASTLGEVCDELGIAAEEVLAFGDMPNDVAMLRWAGTSYAMENAHPRAREAATRIAPRNDEDGVARILTDLFLT